MKPLLVGLLCGTPLAAQSIDLGAIDQSVSPCADFFQYACGNWIAHNPIPPDQPQWGRFNELFERNLATLRGILEESRGEKIGDFYAACMDEKAIEAKGARPLGPQRKRIAALRSKSELASLVAGLHRIGASVLFRFTSRQDFKDSSQVIAELDQGGLGLPDRDYYLKDDPKSVALRGQYLRHVENMLRLLAEAPERAKVVMAIETALANGSLDRVARRQPARLYNRMSVTELETLAPSFDWKEYFRQTGVRSFDSLNVAVPDFFRQLEATLADFTLDDLKTYFTWHLAHSAPVMPKAFVEEDFSFYGRILAGQKELRPRWKRCVSAVDRHLGEALGKRFVERTFGAEGQQRALEMVKALEAALGRDIQSLDWMTPATKKEALAKLHGITEKIGYPARWRDYAKLAVARGDAYGNAVRAREFELERRLSKIGKPVDRSEFPATPPTVDAYYDAQLNSINFPAGILQPPFFQARRDDAANFGAIGAVIGHELTHGFDDQGRQFDARGNFRDWWRPEDATEFEKRAQCLVDEYGGFTAIGDVKVNGKLTLGENVADNGGVRIAYMALIDTLTRKPSGRIEGYTPEQRFFLSFGQVFCAQRTPEFARMLANTDAHSPPEHRVNGVVSNMPEFQRSFACQAGQPMLRFPACRVW